MWTYDQATGQFSGNGISSQGYSGFDDGKNNPAMQDVPDVGPIPRGSWLIARVIQWDPEKGPLVMVLSPAEGTETFGRPGFLIHGDSIEHPGEASHGCIILDHATRQAIVNSEDRELTVS
jgi:hypothetical protein